jgi:hypothetical protein
MQNTLEDADVRATPVCPAAPCATKQRGRLLRQHKRRRHGRKRSAARTARQGRRAPKHHRSARISRGCHPTASQQLGVIPRVRNALTKGGIGAALTQMRPQKELAHAAAAAQSSQRLARHAHTGLRERSASTAQTSSDSHAPPCRPHHHHQHEAYLGVRKLLHEPQPGGSAARPASARRHRDIDVAGGAA